MQLKVDETTYEDGSGNVIPFVPPKKVLVAASGLAGQMAYAGISQVNEQESGMSVVEGRRVPLVYFEKGEDYRKLRLSARPVPVPTDLASWTVLTVLA